MRSRGASVAAIALVVFGAAAAIGDEVKKRDGTVLEGEVIEDTSDHVTIRNKLGDIRIARKDIEAVKKPKGLDLELEKLKRDTIKALEALAKKAEKEKREDALRAIDSQIQAVREWKFPLMESGKKDAKKPDEGKDEGREPKGGNAERRAADYVDWVDAAVENARLQTQPGLNGFQQDQQVDKYAESINGKRTSARMRITEIAPWNDYMSVTGVVGPYKPTFFFLDDGDKKRLQELRAGDEILIEGVMDLKKHFLPGIQSPSFRVLKAK